VDEILSKDELWIQPTAVKATFRASCFKAVAEFLLDALPTTIKKPLKLDATLCPGFLSPTRLYLQLEEIEHALFEGLFRYF